MAIRALGLNSRTAPVEVRELFSFDAQGVAQTLDRWRRAHPGIEAALVSTCNRTELYCATEDGDLPEFEQIFPFLVAPRLQSRLEEFSWREYERNFHSFEGYDAALHMFSVASSLDSMILGEPQILMQLKRAYEIAHNAGATGPILNEAFQTAFKTAKRVSVETDIFKRRVSVPSVAVVDFVLNIFERLDDKQTLVLGAGEMAEETLKFLVDYGAKSISVANRSRDKGEALASQWNGRLFDWEDRFSALQEADLVVCATGASDYVVTLDQYLETEKKRRPGRPLFILDLAVPRNVDEGIGKRPNVYLYSIDDLESACTHNRELRDREIPRALKIVRAEAERFVASVKTRRSIETIRLLRDSWNEIKDSEIERLLHRVSCNEHDQEEIRCAFDRLVNKLLHSPTVSLRNASQNDAGPKLTETLKKIFRLPSGQNG